ncbi:uncharacterized protein [Polyergus mexicanus]|uniref:uncharacterized protein n=1 Tax=Polyergus mexicanus TaxID=615972 RepID=UPI0038B46E41
MRTYTKDAMSAIVLTVESYQSNEWCLDRGATRHMCNDPKKFLELDDTERCEIHTAAERRTKSIGASTVKLNIKLRDDNVNQIKLQNTLLVPGFRNNLLSVSCMTDNGYTVIFTKDSAEVKHRDGTVAIKAKRQGQSYVANEGQTTYANNTITNNSTNENKKQ